MSDTLRNCGLCDKALLRTQKKFCSQSCKGKGLYQASLLKGFTMKGKTHNKSARQSIAEALLGKVGEDSRNWKGGKSRAYRVGYYSAPYREWRISVFERDNYLCQDCGVSGSKVYLTAHHIKSFTHYPELRLEVSNGKTLCEPCHSKTDNYKGRANSFKIARSNNLII